MDLQSYLREIKLALPPHFAPGGIYHGNAGAMRLAREVGYGLGGFEGAEKIVQSLYSDLLVRFTFGNVPVDAKPWFNEMRKAMDEYRIDMTDRTKIEWLGLNTVKIDGQSLTDKEAIAYGAKCFEVDEDQIELKHTGGAVLVRVMDDELILPTFDEWLRITYGVPEPGTELYIKYQAFGYGVYLINAYPETFNATGKTHEEIYDEERDAYYWYCLDAAAYGDIDNPPSADKDAIIGLLDGANMVRCVEDVEVDAGLLVLGGSCGVELWDVGTKVLCLFIPSDEDIVLVAVKPDQIVNDNRAFFSSWEDLG